MPVPEWLILHDMTDLVLDAFELLGVAGIVVGLVGLVRSRQW